MFGTTGIHWYSLVETGTVHANCYVLLGSISSFTTDIMDIVIYGTNLYFLVDTISNVLVSILIFINIHAIH